LPYIEVVFTVKLLQNKVQE